MKRFGLSEIDNFLAKVKDKVPISGGYVNQSEKRVKEIDKRAQVYNVWLSISKGKRNIKQHDLLLGIFHEKNFEFLKFALKCNLDSKISSLKFDDYPIGMHHATMTEYVLSNVGIYILLLNHEEQKKFFQKMMEAKTLLRIFNEKNFHFFEKALKLKSSDDKEVAGLTFDDYPLNFSARYIEEVLTSKVGQYVISLTYENQIEILEVMKKLAHEEKINKEKKEEVKIDSQKLDTTSYWEDNPPPGEY